ncbi:MAG: restriction endonuclease subunit S [Bacteroidota bacterium]
MKKGWEMKKLGDVCEYKSGTTISPSLEKSEGDLIYVKVGDMNLEGNEDFITTSSRYVDSKSIKKSQIIPEGAIIFPKRGGAIATNKKRRIISPTIVDLNTMALVPGKAIDKDYLFFWFKQIDLSELSNGTSIPQINNYSFENIFITYPKSHAEQQQIVSILDEAFAAIEQAKENVRRNLQNAKELFQSELNSIFSKKGDGWVEKKLGDKSIIEIVDGDRGVNYPKKEDFRNEGYCVFMNTGNVRIDGFVFSEVMFITKDKDEKLRKGKLKRNDVIMTTRGTIGNLGVYDDKVKFEHIRINSGMLIFRPNLKFVHPQYLFELLRSSIIKEQIKKHVSGAAQPQLPIGTLIHFTFPLPETIDAQMEIVKKLTILSAETRRLKAKYQQKLNSLDELKESILQRAFSGELTAREVIA